MILLIDNLWMHCFRAFLPNLTFIFVAVTIAQFLTSFYGNPPKKLENSVKKSRNNEKKILETLFLKIIKNKSENWFHQQIALDVSFHCEVQGNGNGALKNASFWKLSLPNKSFQNGVYRCLWAIAWWYLTTQLRLLFNLPLSYVGGGEG